MLRRLLQRPRWDAKQGPRGAHAAKMHPLARPCFERLEDRIVLNAGMLDPTFGSGGLVTTDASVAASSISLRGAPLQPDATGTKILVADTELPPGSPTFVPALYRYNPDGQLDQSFGLHGRVGLNLGPTGLLAFA